MASKAKIKDSARDMIIAYNGSAVPLGMRTDIDEFATIVHRSGRQDYKQLFEVLPSLEELVESSLDAQLAPIAPVQQPSTPAVTPQQSAAPVKEPGK